MRAGDAVLKRIYCVLSEPGGRGVWPERLMARILPRMNQQADLYLVSRDLRGDWGQLVRLLKQVTAHLSEWEFLSLNLRPVHPVAEGEMGPLQDLYQLLFKWIEPFHRQALAHQVASRWMILPVLQVTFEPELKAARALADFLRKRMMLASFAFRRSSGTATWAEQVETSRERILVEDLEGLLTTLATHDLFDDLLQWALSGEEVHSSDACGTLVVDTVRGTVQRCPKRPPRPYAGLEEIVREEGEKAVCLVCWDEVPGRVRATLGLNRREEEGSRVQHRLGVRAFARGDLPGAVGHLETVATAAGSEPLRGESLLYLGIIRLQLGEVEEAHRALSEARGLLGDSGSVLYHLGRCEFARRDYIAAADLFHQALESGVPAEMEQDLRLHLGISHIHLEEFSESLEVLMEAREPRPPVRFYRAMALLGLGRREEALAGFQEALAQGPDAEDLPSVHFYIGHCLKEMGRWDEAIRALCSALAADPKSYEAWNLLGYCYFRLGRHQDAIQAFLKALEIHPRSAIDHANIASNLRDMGDMQGAVRWYRKALQLDPTVAFAVENLRKLVGTRQGP